MTETISAIQSALSTGDEETRRSAIQGLRGVSAEPLCPLLFTAMGDESWRVRKEAVDVFVASEPDEGMIYQLLELLRCDDNAGLRNSAAEALTKLGCRSIQPLVKLVDDPDVDVRKFVIDVMGAIGSSEFYAHLLSALADPDENVASAAAEHLGNLGDARAVPELIRSTVSNDKDFFRFNALAAIGKLAAPAPVPDEIKQLATNEILRKAVFACLGSIADDSAASLLVEGMASRQKSSRKAAVIALHKIYLRSAPDAKKRIELSLQQLKGGGTVPLLLGLFDPANHSLSEALLEILTCIGDIRIIDLLLKAFAHERLSVVAVKALKQLGADGMQAMLAGYASAADEPRAAICALIGECAYRTGGPILCSALCDPAPVVRKSAVIAAGKLGLIDCIPGVVRLLDDSDCDVRSSAVSCLKSLALIDRTLIQAVAHNMAVSEQSEQRRNAAILYAALGDGDRLSLLVKDEDALVRQASVASIGKLHMTDARGILLIALADEDPDVRIAAAEALGEVGDAEVVTALLHALHDEDAWVQSTVLKSLARVAPDSVRDAIQLVFDHADGLVKITCLELLDVQGSPQSLQLVEQALESSDSEVVKHAFTILARRSAANVTRFSDRLLSHPSWDVRVACVRAVSQLPHDQASCLLAGALEHETNDVVRTQILDLLKGLK